MDEFELDTKLLVGPLEQRGRDLDLRKHAVKHVGYLYQGMMSPLSERFLVAKVVNVILIEL